MQVRIVSLKLESLPCLSQIIYVNLIFTSVTPFILSVAFSIIELWNLFDEISFLLIGKQLNQSSVVKLKSFMFWSFLTIQSYLIPL